MPVDEFWHLRGGRGVDIMTWAPDGRHNEGIRMGRAMKKATREAAANIDPAVEATVATVIAGVRARGDDAVRHYSQTFDSWYPEKFRLEGDDIERIIASVPPQVQEDIRTAQANVRNFASHQRGSLHDSEVETAPGVFLGQRNMPVTAAGAYVLGGRYPLVASAHMTIITAKVAGVERVTACTPPMQGRIPAASVAAMAFAGAD